MKNKENPCFGCRDRKSIGTDGYDCHPGCEKYAKLKEAFRAERELKREGIDASIVHRTGIMRSIDKRRRGK